MRRVYNSNVASVVTKFASYRRRILRNGMWGPGSRRVSRLLERQRDRMLCVALMGSLLAASSPFAPQTVTAMAKEWRAGALSWIADNGFSTKLNRGFALGLESYQKLAVSISRQIERPAANHNEAPEAFVPATSVMPSMLVSGAPTNLAVTSSSSSVISLTWSAPAGTIDHYQVERSQSPSGPFITIASPTSPSYSDNTVSSGNAYLYRVRAVDGAGTPSMPSTMALGTAISFTDDPLVAGVTVVKAQHLAELRQAVNAVRSVAGLSAASWTDTTLTGVTIKAVHVQELRDRLGEALTALSVSAPSYTDPVLATGANGTVVRKAHIEELRQRSTRDSSASTGTVVTGGDLAVARLDPMNRTGGGGEDPLSRNYNWSVPLVSLPGRAGLNFGLSLSYNSLVWTRSGSYISFNDDGGFPSPGFRLGFPVIQSAYFNSEVGKNAFLLITPDGARAELRQVGTSALYESADSSHLLLDSSTMMLRTTDGTQLSYVWKGSDYECTQIKDRNGNFITVNYTSFGRIDTVVDTLNRTIQFNYNTSDNTLASITQTWTVGGQSQQHTWASFSYTANEVHTNFVGLTNVGPADGSTIKSLTRVTLDDNSRFDFDYTYWAQIWKINNYAADGHLLNYHGYNLPGNWLTALDDCPRFTARFDWAENWNRSGSNGPAGLPAGAEQEVTTTTWAVPASGSWNLPDNTPQSGMVAQVTQPADGTYNKIYFAGTAGTSTGWSRGVPSMVETYGKTDPSQGGTAIKQRTAVTNWTQDNTTVSYLLNPRAAETNIYDFDSGGQALNHARTAVTYQSVTLSDGTSCQLPQDVREYQANATTVLRRSHTEYNLATAYTSRRIIGLASEQTLYQVDANTSAETPMSKVGYTYDGSGSILGSDAPVQHDNTSFGASFLTGRANLTSVSRFDVTNVSAPTTSTMAYNTAGAVVSTTDPRNHTVAISYADAFAADGTTLETGRPLSLAYPTSVTDADNYTSRVRYNYDFGAATWKQTPLPNTTQDLPGPEQKFTYDSFGRLERVTNLVNNAYTRTEYPASQNRVDTYTTIQEGMGEAHSFQVMDGYGHGIASASDHPGSPGGFSGQLVLYDKLGRAIKSSNPTETTASGTPTQWAATGDDQTAGWLYTSQTYDWKGRRLVTTNTDGTTKEASYAGCGCAGGQVTTLTDEGTIDGGVAKRRQQKVYADVLGRTIKTEVLNWQGPSVYSTTINSYNARDQITFANAYQGEPSTDGSCPSGTCQQVALTYDGYGRLKTKHVPEQDSNAATTYNYSDDDMVSSVIDARGASQVLSYNNRHLLTGVTYSAPSGSSIAVPTTVGYGYDAVGNRTSMTDGLGSMSYQYDQLSRLTSETRQFTDPLTPYLNGSFTLSYAYNLAGELKKITDHTNTTINYNYGQTGQMSSITGADNLYGGISQYASGVTYRAWGGLKGLTYGNNYTVAMSYNVRLEATEFELAGRPSQYGASTVMKTQFSYYADGALRYAHDLLDERFDRAYSYHHTGMLKEAYSGSESRDYINGTNSGTQTGPYRQSYQQNVFGNMTQRDNRFWSQTDSSTLSYVNNRRQDAGFQYDADGNLIQDPDVQYAYDAAARNTSLFSAANNRTIASSYDGDGQIVKRTETLSGSSTVSYLLRSSAMGGNIIEELNQTGQKLKGYVFAGQQLLATQESNIVKWRHQNPLTGSSGTSGTQGWFSPEAEPDPMGVNVGFEDPYNSTCCFLPPPDDQIMPMLLGSFGSGRCSVDGMAIDCGWAMSMLENGSAVQCPNNDCGPRTVTVNITYTSGRRDSYNGLTRPFAAYANGSSGFGLGGMLLPDGFNVRFTGAAAQAAAGAFFSGMANGNFGSAVREGLDAGYRKQALMNASDPAEGGQGKGKKTKDSKECAEHRARLLGDSVNKAALESAWKRSQVGDISKTHEEGGLLGLIIDNGQEYGPSYVRDLRRNVNFSVPANVPSAGLKGFTLWAQGQLKAAAGMVNYMYWYHTHPHDAGDIVTLPTGEQVFINGVDYPSDKDKGISGDLNLTGVIVTKTHILVYNDSGILCTFDR